MINFLFVFTVLDKYAILKILFQHGYPRVYENNEILSTKKLTSQLKPCDKSNTYLKINNSNIFLLVLVPLV